MNKLFWFYIQRDYRSGTNIYTFNKPPVYEKELKEYVEEDEECEDITPEDACEISLEIPEHTNYRLYIVNEYPNYKSVWFIDVNEYKDLEKIYLKIFSQIHDCLPFVVTDYTISYKEEGYYPEISNEIKEIEEFEGFEFINEDYEGLYFIVVIDSDGDEIFTKLLQPIT